MTIKNNIIAAYEHNKLYKCDEKCGNCTSFSKDYSCCINFCSSAYFNELRDYCVNSNLDCGFDYIPKENCIKFDKYTGIIQLQDGTYLEILPKLEGYSITQSRKIFENLVLASHNLTKEYKHNKDTLSKTNKNNHIAEIFISVFCTDILKILKRGIKKSYIRKSENLCKYKGKLNFPKQIKHNIITKNKFFVDYNEFSMDIAENRILKSACLYLIKRTKNDENKKTMRRLLIELDDVSACTNLDKDIQNIQINRLHEYYTRPLKYAEFFLRQDNFLPNRGRTSLPALLFPLNEMFEDYIENILKENKIKYYPQYKKHCLVHKNNEEFFITKMDFVIIEGSKALILDAKWKELDINDDKLGVNQNDLYQLFAYSQLIKHKEKNVETVEIALLYPKTDKFHEVIKWQYFNDTNIFLIPVNVENPHDNENFVQILKS